jgi:hypothetical protein
MTLFFRMITFTLVIGNFAGLSWAQDQDFDCPPGPFSCVPPGPGDGGGVSPNPPPPPPFLEIDPKFVNVNEIVNQFLLASENSVTILELPKEGLFSPGLLKQYKVENFKRDSFYLVPNKFVGQPYRLNQYVIVRGKDLQ